MSNRHKILLALLFLFTNTLDAQLYFFGRNKVQYEKFNWQIIKTDHFNIYFYDDFKEMAEIGAEYAEEAFEELKVKFDHIVTTRIPLIFYNTHIHFQQTNTLPGFIPEGVGGFFEFIKGRVVIPYQGNLEQFRHVIRHELVHVFMTSKILNELRDHRLTVDRFPPLWFVEGLAEYWSYHWDTQAEMVMRDAVLNNIFVPASDFDRIYGSFLMYKEGQAFLEFIADKYGEDKILGLMENFWRFNTFKETIEFTLGEKFEKVDNYWVYHVKQNYFPLYLDKFPHFVDSRKLTDFGFNFSPNFHKSKNGNDIYFVGNRTGYTSIYKLDYIKDTNEVLSPDLVLEGEREETFEAFHLLENSIDVSKEGIIAFVTKSGDRDALHFYSIDHEFVMNSFEDDELVSITAPRFSNDGKFIAFSAIDNKGFSDLYELHIESMKLTRLTNDYFQDTDPCYGPNDEYLVFISDRTDGVNKQKLNLFKFDRETKYIEYITYVDADFSRPRFSPSFDKLYFTSDYDGTNNIWTMDESDLKFNSGMTQLTHYITSVYDFSFINDTTMITSAFEKFSFQLYEIDLSKIPDSLKHHVEFDYSGIGDKWIAKEIMLDSEDDIIHYEKEYTLDYAVSQVITDPVYGTRGGALLSLSDLLGDDKYYFLIYNTAEVQSELLRNFNVAISRVNSYKRTNFGYGIFHFTGRRYDIRQSNEYFYERSFGGYFSLIYPFSTFQRLEASTSLANSDKEIDFGINSRKALLLSNQISFVHDNTLWMHTGPIDGSRFRLLFGYTSDLKYSNVNFYSFIADYRQYFRLGFRTTVATRASVFVNHGKEARRYIAGGSWDLRGWRRWSVRGEKLWLSSVELRYPLIDQFVVNFPFFGMGFSSIRGALYFDAGGAWDDEYVETLGSVGVGVRWNFFNVITLRYDIGKKIEGDFSYFQPGLFYQFFFGWDF
ncbi:MAG: hypothetical protein K9J16_02890 [Melioribacteraceae bacterium]|nr:hypothetical protein [Melioribacteraceae bacterium]MCF8352955.1 hypothetical protein [Melioribacteraceae bacterium]MCF8395838.1 hypothetical protein [Melioribacteraceae bacterium]MCF8417472.1 hypothetical protein [Melioribacteraceae bacterium]